VLLKILPILFIFSGYIFGQTLQTELEKVFNNNRQNMLAGYLSPLSKTFGVNLGSATYHNADSYKFPHFDIGVSYLTTKIPAGGLFADAAQNPSVFGKTLMDSIYPSGLNMNQFNLPVIQFSIGLGDNTNLLLRYTKWEIAKIGQIIVYAGGIKYELENLLSITPIPVDIAVLAMYQKYQAGEFLEGAVFNMNIIGSKELKILPIQFYGGAGFLKNITEVTNPVGVSDETISVGGLEEIRYQLGVNYSFFFLNLSIEYNFGEYTTISSGLRLVL
jgi:hypothetical protein